MCRQVLFGRLFLKYLSFFGSQHFSTAMDSLTPKRREHDAAGKPVVFFDPILADAEFVRRHCEGILPDADIREHASNLYGHFCPYNIVPDILRFDAERRLLRLGAEYVHLHARDHVRVPFLAQVVADIVSGCDAQPCDGVFDEYSRSAFLEVKKEYFLGEVLGFIAAGYAAAKYGDKVVMFFPVQAGKLAVDGVHSSGHLM